MYTSFIMIINRMERILERYERYSHAGTQHTSTNIESQGISTMGYANLKARIELLQKRERHLMGEELDSLSLKEIHNLEQQIDTSLKHIRLRKVCRIFFISFHVN
ncbi:putative transcription factor, K-box [Helianthus annuus]|nr:putative transcription factor, K-box [Helianthus annuus]KAJ0680390.1 putative transcription factor, K-box [Helianthus annuus]